MAELSGHCPLLGVHLEYSTARSRHLEALGQHNDHELPRARVANSRLSLSRRYYVNTYRLALEK